MLFRQLVELSISPLFRRWKEGGFKCHENNIGIDKSDLDPLLMQVFFKRVEMPASSCLLSLDRSRRSSEPPCSDVGKSELA